jgi:4-amino-4-deoxy-L-arabinose transferase-like glycosyltransferase
LPKGPSAPPLSERFIAKLTSFSEWRKGTGLVLLILLLALLSRTIALSSFPYFPASWPWNGIAGAYLDEHNISLLTPSSTVYFPFLQIALMDLVINFLGYSMFSFRLVSALFSSVTSVLVYFSAYELFNKKLPAFLSSLFFIFMTPALIYGRMAFLENGAATFLVAAFLSAIKYVKTSKASWLLCSGVFSGLSFLCKQTGLVAMVFLFLLIFIYKPKSFRLLLKVLIVAGLVAFLYFVQILAVNPTYVGEYFVGNIYVGIGDVSWLAALVGNLMPTGVNVMWVESYLAPYKDLFRLATLDFWYIFAFFVIAYLMVKERDTTREVVLAFMSYILVMLLIGHTNSYYVILMQPFMAIPFGYGVLKLEKMSGAFSCVFSLILCLAASTYISYYIAYFMTTSSTDVFSLVVQFAVVCSISIVLIAKLWSERERKVRHGILNRILLIYYAVWLVSVGYIAAGFHKDIAATSIQFVVAVPIAIIGIFRLIYDKVNPTEAASFNKLLVIFYVGCLVVGSYVLPVFYPGYFAQSTVPV